INFDVSKKVNLRVLDLMGKIVFEDELRDDVNELGLTHLPKGVYTVQLIHGTEVYSGKLMLQ
ncbi:MAG: T9SS type A sorting domain-containing protein, partial [Bacteroidota bacterium]